MKLWKYDISGVVAVAMYFIGMGGEAYSFERMTGYGDDGRIVLYYVIQVAPGTENKAEEQIKKIIRTDLYDRCFHLTRRVRKKIRGEWKEFCEKLLPGYVFIISGSIQELYMELKQVSSIIKVLGRENEEQFVPLPANEEKWIERIMDSTREGSEMELSQVSVSEDNTITILSGPLKNLEGQIKKINLHRRTAEVEIDFMNRKTVIHLGIEMAGEKK